jgi:hypothetical protein
MRNRSICGLVNASPLMWGAVLCMQIGIPAHGHILHADGPLPSFEVTTIKPVKAAGMESGLGAVALRFPEASTTFTTQLYERL